MKITIMSTILVVLCSSITGFSFVNNRINRDACVSNLSMPRSETCLFAEGFGGGGMGKKAGDKKKKKDANKDKKLKPKQQWDRYSKLKREPKIQVGVRIKEESDEWLEVGRVKSKDSEFTEPAVFRQRGIIAEHAKRLYPLNFATRKAIEWGYRTSDGENGEWKVVDKSCMTDVEGLEKLIGFEGRPDPASGYYCVYHQGKREETSFK